MKRITFPVGLYQCNCSILYCEETLEAIIVDPGSEAESIIKKIQSNGLKVKYLLHTHAHLDHFGATKEVKTACCGAKTALHKDDTAQKHRLPMKNAIILMYKAEVSA